MWMIFDANGDFIGTITENAKYITNILQGLEKADCIIQNVSRKDFQSYISLLDNSSNLWYNKYIK